MSHSDGKENNFQIAADCHRSSYQNLPDQNNFVSFVHCMGFALIVASMSPKLQQKSSTSTTSITLSNICIYSILHISNLANCWLTVCFNIQLAAAVSKFEFLTTPICIYKQLVVFNILPKITLRPPTIFWYILKRRALPVNYLSCFYRFANTPIINHAILHLRKCCRAPLNYPTFRLCAVGAFPRTIKVWGIV